MADPRPLRCRCSPMKTKFRSRGGLIAAITLAALALPLVGSARPTPDCDESCLKGYIDQYLAALAAHDPARLPTAKDVRFTENGVAIPLGEALWVTFKRQLDYRHDFYEPQ